MRFAPLAVPALLAGLLLAVALPATAKPIAYQGATTVMLDYAGEGMQEAQAFYAPRHWLSLGGGWLRQTAHADEARRDIAYVRANLLARRWNLPGAQGNVFVWGGLGRATGDDFAGPRTTPSAGFAADYETLWFYSSLRSEYHHNSAFSQRNDTLQLGFAPYAHDYDRLATWVLIQARHATGERMRDDLDYALLLRFFKGARWLELGIDQRGRLQSKLLLTF